MNTSVMKRHVRDSVKSLRRNGWMTVAAVSAVTVTLLLVGIVLALIFNVNRVSQQVENDVQVRVTVNRNVSSAGRKTLQKDLAGLPEVTSVRYRSRAQELDAIVSGYGKQWQMFRGDDNPLNDVFLVKTSAPHATISVARRAAKLKNVSAATYGGKTARRLFRYVNTLRNWGLAFMVMLLLVAVFLISNTIRITILSRSAEIGVMRLVGATNWYIRWPFLLEGAWTGLLGAILPVVVVDFAYSLVLHNVNMARIGNGYSLFPQLPFLLWLDLLLAGIGVVIGAAGAVVSMRRFLKV